VSILSTEGDGTASDELIATVNDTLSADDKRPVADRLTVQSAEIVNYEIDALLYLYPGPESEPILSAADDALRAWLGEQGKSVAMLRVRPLWPLCMCRVQRSLAEPSGRHRDR
jgi:phage-related baseplate assembly protein